MRVNADPFQNGSPLALFDFPILAPLSTFTLSFGEWRTPNP
jgi:hypothetical protein